MVNPWLSLRMAMLLAGTPAQAVGQVLDGPQGRAEFIGLERWSAEELLESIQGNAPDKPLAGCAVTMKVNSALPMPPSSATVPNASKPSNSSCPETAELYTVIVGVEDSARVRLRIAGSETIELPERSQPLKSEALDGEADRLLTATL